MNSIKIDLFLISLVLLLTFFTWRHILSLQFTGESWGFIGTIPPKGNLFEIVYQEVASLDEFTIDRILSGILIPKFGDQIHLYMWFQLVYMLFIDLLLYFIVKQMTGSKLAGFLTAFLFGSSFIANFETYSGGGYLYFAGRATLAVPALIAVYFLYLYLTKKFKLYFYFISLTLYAFTLMMSFFGTYFVPILITYPIVYLLFGLREIRQIFWKLILLPIPYIIITLYIIRGSLAFTNESIFDFVFEKFSYTLTGILQQLTVLTFPMGELFLINDKFSIEYFGILVITVLIYCYAFFANSKINTQWKVLQMTALLSAIGMLFFNVYLQAAETLNTFGSTRYFYFPSIMVAIFFGIFLTGILTKGRKLLNLHLIIIILVWFSYNNVHIQRRLKTEEWVHNANKQTLEILRSWAPETKKNPSYLYLPATLGGYGGQFVIQFFSHPQGKVDVEGLESLDLDKVSKLGFSPNNLFVMHFDPLSRNVYDITEQTRAMFAQEKRRDKKF